MNDGGDGYAATGETLTFSLKPYYPGIGLLSNVRIIDPLPAGTTYVASSANAGGTFGPYTPLPAVPGRDDGPPVLDTAMSVGANYVVQGGTVNVTLNVKTSVATTNVSPTPIQVSGGAATCAGPIPASANLAANVGQDFAWTCTLSDVGEYIFSAGAQDALGTTAWPDASSASVLSSPGGGTNVVTWNLGSNASGTPGETLTSGFPAGVYGFRGGNTKEFSKYGITNSSWTAKAQPTNGIEKGGSLTVDPATHIVYALEGNAKIFYKYDIATNTWTALANTSDNANEGGAVQYLAVGGTKYVYALLGGSNRFRRYNVASNNWTTLANTPASVKKGGALTTDGTYLYALQGDGKTGFWRCNATTTGTAGSCDTSWTVLNPTPGNVGWGGSLTRVGNYIYALQGDGKTGFWRYDIAANTWSPATTLAAAPGNVGDGGALTTDGTYIYALQGKTTAFWRYNIAANTWTTTLQAANFTGNVGQGGALVYDAGVTPVGRFTSMIAIPSLVSGGDTVKVLFRVESSVAVNTVTPGTLTPIATGGASASCGSPSPASQDIPANGSVEFTWTCTVTAGTSPGSLAFSANATGAGAVAFPTATTRKILVSPVLTYQATVAAGAPAVIRNTGILAETSGNIGTLPSNTTETATSASIGDFVWADLNGDGQQTGEVGLAGVKVYVDSNGNGAWDAGEPSAITDATGAYRIYGLSMGTYTVRTDPATYPAGYLPTTAPVHTTPSLTAGQQYSAADFGLKPAGTGQIGDTVWLDADNNGAQNGSEAGLPGIGVTLERQIGGVWYPVATTTTGADGKYLFSGLIKGDYRVTVNPNSTVTSPYGGTYTLGSAMTPTYDKDGTGTPHVALVTLADDTAVWTDRDFGYRWAGSIAGRGWYDPNSNGVIDSGEAGAPGSSIVLYRVNADGSREILTFFETSAANGYDYLFANLPPGNYAVGASEQEVPAPAGSPNAGTIGTMVFSTPDHYPVTLGAGQTVTDKNFGFVEAALLEGTLFHDVNSSAVLDSGEQGLSGIVITLTGTDSNGNPVTRTTTTDATGVYAFIVPAGNYTISYSPVAVAAAFPGLTLATTPTSLFVSAQAGHETLGLDFGVDNSGVVGDWVWADANRNGLQDAGEAGMAGVTVYLCASSPCAAGNAVATTATDATGKYSFTGLADGTYSVGVNTATVPAGYTATTVHQGNTALDSGSVTGEPSTVSGGAANNTIDFGFQPPASTYSISGNLWNDNGGGTSGNAGNGALDTGEPYLGGVTVCLYASDGTTLITCATTDASGNYSFPGVSNGSYVVKVDTTTLPAAYFVQSKDPDATLDNQTAVTVNSADVSGKNFAYWQQPGSISGAVCVGGSNGICDSGEPLVAAVSVTLIGAGPDGILGTADDTTQTKTTDSSGAYSFTGLLPGLYQVVKTNPANTTSVADRDGGNPDNITVNLAGGQAVTGRDFEVNGGADLAVTKTDGLATVTSGQTGVVYTLSVTNNGIIPAAGVQLVDTLDANLTYVSSTCATLVTGTTYTWNLADLAARGGSYSCTMTVDVKSGLADGTIVTNYAKATTTTIEPNVTDNERSDRNTVQTTPAPDLQITKTDGQTQVLAGAALAYTINYKNVGNADAANVVMVDALPANVDYVSSSPSGTYSSGDHTVTWDLGTVAQGADVNITLNVTVKNTLLPGAVVLNRVNITTTGTDRNPADNTASDSDIVVAPYVVLEKSVTGPAYVGGDVTYSIRWENNSTDTAADVKITDVLPANTTLVAGSITAPGAYDSPTRTITWNLGSKTPGASGTVSFKVTVNSGVIGTAASQTAPTLSTETGSGSVTVTSKTTAYTSLPWCDSAFNPKCLTYRGLYGGANAIGPTGWNDNPRATAFTETGWTPPVAATVETGLWMPAETLGAEWTAVNTTGVTTPNTTFFRQAFCLPLNASGLGASVDLSGDDIATVYLNGISLGERRGAGSYSMLSGVSGIQSGINILAVQLLNNTHGGHTAYDEADHSGLLFNLQASYGSLRPFAYAPATILAGQTATLSVDENALGGRTPYGYRVDWGDGTIIDYLATPSAGDPRSWTHAYATAGTYLATVTARAQYGCTGTDQVTVTVLPATSKILANTANVAYKNTAGTAYSGQSGAGILLSVGTVTGFVYTDADGDGVYTAGVDTPAAGVNVSITDGYGKVHTGVTGADGNYTITEVGAGYAAVTLVNPPSGVQTQGTNPTTVLVSAGLTTTEENNGFYNPTAIGNRVWLDENGDGIQDAGEAGIANISVQLWNSDHTTLLAATVTDADGNYVFKGIPAGAYQVDVLDSSLPMGLVHSTPTFTGDLTNKADPYTVTITAGQENLTADFGYNWAPSADVTGNTNTGAIGDRVWIDADGDGRQDPEELGLSGVTVELWYDSNGDGTIDALYPGGTATTNATGGYVFDGLPAGSYLVKITAGVSGYTQTGDPDAALDGMTTPPIVLAPGDVFVNADFGYQPAAGMAATIGDTIWLDANANGTQGGLETGIPGVTVALIRDTNGNGAWDAGEPIVATDVTDASGGYQFTGAPVGGNYLVWVSDTANVLGGLAPSYDSNGVGTPNLSAVSSLPATGNDAQDFGYKPFGQTTTTGLIGDTVFLDRDNSGTYTAGEGLEGVTVRLYDSAGTTLLAATVTDENGRYAFPALPAGTYTVVVDTAALPGGLSNTVDPDGGTVHQSTVTLTAGQINLAQDFGYQGTNSVSGTLWRDTNADGFKDTGETTVFAGVTVALYDANGNVIATTVTNASGDYSFANLPNGTYTVRVTDVANVLNGAWHSLGTANTDNNSQPDPLTVNLIGSTPITYADFGYTRGPAGLGDFVWQDTNANGIQDAGEPGIAGVEVTLTLTWPGGATTRVTTTTDASGAYSFGNLLLDENFDGAGTGEPIFNISVATPAGYVPTLTDQGGDDTDSDPNGVTATVTEGANNTSYDFGLRPLPGAIGSTVWLDENGDGVQDAGEAGIANIKVTLTGTDIYGAAVTLTTYTDANGGYAFADVLPGSYTVTVDHTTLPAGLAANPTYDEDGSGTAHTSPVTLLPGQEHLTADFGYNWAPAADVTGATGTGAIGDRVWIDADGDGVQDANEAGLGGVTVTLYTDPDGNGVYDTPFAGATDAGGNPIAGGATTTAADGSYIFDSLPQGSYVVKVTLPAGYTQTGDPDGVKDNATTAPVILAPGDVYVNADFGYRLISGANTIGNQIFLDANGDGNLGAGEPGIAGVTVALLDSMGKVIATTITDAAGAYSFPGLPDGAYTVWVNDTANVLGTLAQSSTPNNAADGGQPCGACTGRNAVTVSGGAGSAFQDFGYTPAGQTTTGGLIGDTIFLDRNTNGLPDAGEGLEGVIVRLYADTNGDGNYDLGEPMLAQAVTDENGNYTFGNLPAGNYVVAVATATLPAGVTNTVDPDTTNSPLNESGVVVSSGSLIHLAQDFGYRDTSAPNTITGTLWADTNADGTLDGAEAGRYAGVTVILYDTAGNVVATTTTGSDGSYSFANLPDGTYRVDVTDDANVLGGAWLSDGPNDGSNNNSQVEPYTVTVSSGQTDETADFGYYRAPAALGNFVWNDLNGDGIQDAGEPGIAGVAVTLTITWPGGATTQVTTATDANGAYSFGNLLLDENFNGTTADGSTEPTFNISVTTPAGYVASPQNATSEELDSDNPAGEAATVTQGQLNGSVDFGFVRGTASVSGTVFDDLDGDGQQDPGEPGLAGVTVTLDDGDPGTPALTASTDALGNYRFTNLLPGAYTITETDPAGYTSTGDADGPGNGKSVIAVTLAAGENVTERNFGDERPGSIAGVVFEDTNNNGVQDAGEGPLAGVQVCAAAGLCTTTAANGAYLIANVPPGNYVVTEADPAGYVSTTPNTIPVSVRSGQAVTGVNYGDEPLAAGTHSIAGTVCKNVNNNGVCDDAGETPLAGVTVKLYDAAGALIATTTTDAAGDYLFVNVPDGTYSVAEVDPAGYISVNDADGDTDNTIAVTVSGAAVTDKDFVDAPAPGALSGTVYEDLNLNGQRDTGEPGITGVTVYLDTNNDGVKDAGEPSTTTDASGNYAFTNLAPGAYTIRETDPTGVVSTGDVDGANDNTLVATVNAGQTTTNQDFGDARLGSLSGSVWNDVNLDGMFDAGESGIPGVSVCLIPDGAGVPVCTITDASGHYEFLNLAPGGYTVVETDPAGTVSTTPGSVRVTVPSGNAKIVNFGDVLSNPALGSISGTVCEDANGDGVCDAVEPPLAGVTVELRDASTGALLRTTTTDANGDYRFPNLPVGSYRVVEVDPAGYTSVNDANGGTDNTISPITIAGGNAAVNQDFVDTIVPGAIGNRIWLDENGNGVQDAGEAGIPNLLVTLTGADSHGNAVLLTTTTDANGGYVFAGLPPSAAAGYTLAVTPPAGLRPTYDENGVGTANTTTVVLAAGVEHMTADFGYNWAPPADVTGNTGTGAMGDRVWIDANGNGKQDPGEPGLGGVTVTLYTDPDGNGVYDTPFAGATDAGGNPIGGGATTTAADGSYIFDSLPQGSYVVKVTLPAGYTQTGDPDAALDGMTTQPIVLAPGDVFVNADFGYQLTGSANTIGNQIFLDANANGKLDAGEPGIPGVTVALLDSMGKVIATTITDAAGAYSFPGLPDGAYTVWVNDTANVLGTLAQSSTPNNAADGGQPCGTCTGRNTVTVSGGAGSAFQDFGYTPAGQTTTGGLIGDTVFLDRDGSGAYTAGEGLEGVTVRLYDSAGTALLATTVTDENGRYAFPALPAGTYTVKVDTATLPAGLTNTVDPDSTKDSQSTVTLTAGQINLAQDFGYQGTNSVAGTLWRDTNADGFKDAGETTVFAGVTVALHDANGNVVATTVTNASGDYSFANLPNGTYTVRVTDEANLLNGYWHSLGAANTDNYSQPDPLTVTLTGSTPIAYADFGYTREPASLGNFVWNDLNKNGIQDAGDPGIDGVRVILTITYPNGAVTTVTTVTGDDPATPAVTEKGWYSFANLLLDENYRTSSGAATPGANQPAYTIAVETPANYTPTLVNATGSTTMNDSDLHTGTYGLATKGQTDVRQGGAVLLAAMNTALGLDGGPGDESNPIASYDFGFVQNPTAVELSSFDATFENGTVTLKWVTVSETDNLGFNMYRADSEAGPWARLNAALIPATEPGSRLGHTYTWSDTTVLPNTTSVYRLEAVDLSGGARTLALITVTGRPNNRIWLPLVARSQ